MSSSQQAKSCSTSPTPPPASFKLSIEGPSRRASVSNLMRAISSDSSGSDIERVPSPLLTVPDLRNRRHSDNSLQILKNLPSRPSSPSTSRRGSCTTSSFLSPSPILKARSSSSLLGVSSSRRRHSSVNAHEIQRFATKLMDSAAESVEKASKVSVLP